PAGRFARFLADDQARPFDLGRAPLLRAALFRTGEREHRFAWTFHHLLFDGWCFSLLFGEIFDLYAEAVAGPPADLHPVRPYRDYIAWLGRQDAAAATAWWRQTLAGFSEPTPLPLDSFDSLDAPTAPLAPAPSPASPDSPEEPPREAVLALPAALAADLAGLA